MEHIHAFFSFVLIISYAPQCTLGSCLLPRSRTLYHNFRKKSRKIFTKYRICSIMVMDKKKGENIHTRRML